MRIPGRKHTPAVTPFGPTAETRSPDKPVEGVGAVSSNAVNVDLSESSKGLRQARVILANVPEVRSEKVAELKDAVDSGSYQVESEKVARKMVDESLRESAHRRRGAKKK